MSTSATRRTANRIPTYGDAKGKIVLMRRYEADGDLAIGIQARPWGGAAISTLDNGPSNPKISRQDYWELGISDEDFRTKWSYVEQQLNAAKNSTTPEVLYLNFTSAAGKAKNGGEPAPFYVAQYIHPKILAYLRQNPLGRYGIVVVDFANAELNTAIVVANDFQ
jgi:1-phosphatidylinositol phosphodiesterase